MSFITLDSIEKLDALFEKSKDTPIVIFKHSLTCPISTDASTQLSIIDKEINLVIVQISRGISNEIERRAKIRHETPQVIVFKDGKPIYQASHYDITAEDLSRQL